MVEAVAGGTIRNDYDYRIDGVERADGCYGDRPMSR